MIACILDYKVSQFPGRVKISKFNKIRYPHWLKNPLIVHCIDCPASENASVCVVELILQQKDSLIIACHHTRDLDQTSHGRDKYIIMYRPFYYCRVQINKNPTNLYLYHSTVNYFLTVWIRK